MKNVNKLKQNNAVSIHGLSDEPRRKKHGVIKLKTQKEFNSIDNVNFKNRIE